MKFKNPLLAVKNLEESKTFYREILGLRIVADFGANVTLTGGVCLQTLDTWSEFIGREVSFGGNDAELYFEEEDFDGFLTRFGDKLPLIHPAYEHRWGQRVLRFTDPDGHIIEVGEDMGSVVRRFLEGGLSQEQIAARMDVPVAYVKRLCK